jgi:uncharacterized protein (TIGR00369 family)
MFDPALDGWRARTLPGFLGLVGPLWTRKDGDIWAYAVLAEERHANPAGLVHGGMLSTLLDHTLSIIAWEANERRPCITIALDVQFVAGARPGDFVVAQGSIVRQTSSMVFAQGYLTVNEQIVATATAILKVR